MQLLAHQGGWDESLAVVTPVAIFAVLLWLANRRAARAGTGAGEPAADTGAADDVSVADDE